MLGHPRIVSTPEGLWVISRTLQSVARVDCENGATIERIIVGTERIHRRPFHGSHLLASQPPVRFLVTESCRFPCEVYDRLRELRKHAVYQRITKEREDRLRSKRRPKSKRR